MFSILDIETMITLYPHLHILKIVSKMVARRQKVNNGHFLGDSLKDV